MPQPEELERRMERIEKIIDGNGKPGLSYTTQQTAIKVDYMNKRIQSLNQTIKWAAASIAIPIIGLILTFAL